MPSRYNAYRFFVQNALRYESESGKPFRPSIPDLSGGKKMANQLDQWILSCNNSLIKFVRAELKAYRLYTVTPRLLQFVDELTNWYVRLNRDRFRSGSDPADQEAALSSLWTVLMTLCKVRTISSSSLFALN